MRVWDLKTGQPLGQPLQGHTKGVRSVAVSAGHIVSGGDDNAVRVWDLKTGQPLGQPLQGHTNSVNSVAVNAGRIVSGSWDRTVRVWDLKTGQPLGAPLQGHTSGVTSVAVSAGHIVSGSDDKTVRVWDLLTHQCLGVLALDATVSFIALAGSHWVIASGNRVQCWQYDEVNRQFRLLSSYPDRWALWLDGCQVEGAIGLTANQALLLAQLNAQGTPQPPESANLTVATLPSSLEAAANTAAPRIDGGEVATEAPAGSRQEEIADTAEASRSGRSKEAERSDQAVMPATAASDTLAQIQPVAAPTIAQPATPVVLAPSILHAPSPVTTVALTAGWVEAIQAQDITAVQALLVQNPALLSEPLAGGYSAYHYLCEHGSAEMLKVSLAIVEAELKNLEELPSPANWHPVHLNALLLQAAAQGEVASLERLTRFGAQVQGTNAQGDTALHKAVQQGQLTAVEWLLQHDADPLQHNQAGQTPLDLAEGQDYRIRVRLAQGRYRQTPDSPSLQAEKPIAPPGTAAPARRSRQSIAAGSSSTHRPGFFTPAGQRSAIPPATGLTAPTLIMPQQSASLTSITAVLNQGRAIAKDGQVDVEFSTLETAKNFQQQLAHSGFYHLNEPGYPKKIEPRLADGNNNNVRGTYVITLTEAEYNAICQNEQAYIQLVEAQGSAAGLSV